MSKAKEKETDEMEITGVVSAVPIPLGDLKALFHSVKTGKIESVWKTFGQAGRVLCWLESFEKEDELVGFGSTTDEPQSLDDLGEWIDSFEQNPPVFGEVRGIPPFLLPIIKRLIEEFLKLI